MGLKRLSVSRTVLLPERSDSWQVRFHSGLGVSLEVRVEMLAVRVWGKGRVGLRVCRVRLPDT